MRRAAEEVLGVRVELMGAGRTDAGVHATGQVAHLKAAVRKAYAPEQLARWMNEELPADIVVVGAREAPLKFHARHDAVARVYEYRYSLRKTAFDKKYVWWVKGGVDVGRMGEAAGLLPGRHDFTQFRATDGSGERESPWVVVERAEVRQAGDRVVFEIEASHFLWRMVRRLAGTLARVGMGEATVEQFGRLLGGKPVAGCDPAEWTAPGAGLFLTRVRYRGAMDEG